MRDLPNLAEYACPSRSEVVRRLECRPGEESDAENQPPSPRGNQLRVRNRQERDVRHHDDE